MSIGQSYNHTEQGATESAFALPGGRQLPLPVFLPVYEPRKSVPDLSAWNTEPAVDGCIVNAYLLYKDRATREHLRETRDLHTYIGFHGTVMTDSGAYQGLRRPLRLANRDIVKFQDRIGADIISPLDVITPPGDKRTTAEKKLEATLKRIHQALAYTEHGVVAGVQQGGRFSDLRAQAVDDLLEAGVSYIALGSLVPFFNRNHNLEFVVRTVRHARNRAGRGIPIHVFGAGDPVELPFLVASGADVFDSSSYGHYAADGWYMTPYGAVRDITGLQDMNWECRCPVCSDSAQIEAVRRDENALRRHNLWTILTVVKSVKEAREQGTLTTMLNDVLQVHTGLFPESDLQRSWEKVCNGAV